MVVRFVSLSFLVLVFGSFVVQGQLDKFNCTDCLQYVDTFSNCIDDYCKEEDNCFNTFYDAQDLGTCCGMPKGSVCKKSGKRAQKCFSDCQPACVGQNAATYLDCTFRNTNTNGCNRADCVTRLLLDREWVSSDSEDRARNDDNLFANIADYISLDEDDIKKCSGTKDMANRVCNIGEDCCDPCNNDLGDFMDCVINDLYRPYVEEQLGLENFDRKCEVKCKEPDIQFGGRSLQTDPANVTTTTTLGPTTLGPTTLGPTANAVVELEDDYDYEESLPFGPGTDGLDENSTEFIIQKCQNRLSGYMAVGNESGSVGEYLGCIMGEAYDRMPEEDIFGNDDKNDDNDDKKTTKSNASSMMKSSVTTALFFIVLYFSS